MTEYVEHLFNTCPECRPNGKRVFLGFKKGSDYTEPCRECGCKFGKILTPADKFFDLNGGHRLTSEGLVPAR